MLFVDTSAFYPLADYSERHHAATSFALIERLAIAPAFAFDLHVHDVMTTSRRENGSWLA